MENFTAERCIIKIQHEQQSEGPDQTVPPDHLHWVNVPAYDHYRTVYTRMTQSFQTDRSGQTV